MNRSGWFSLKWLESMLWAPLTPIEIYSIRRKFQADRLARANNKLIIDADIDRDALRETMRLWKSDPRAALPQLYALAARGSVWCMLVLGHALQTGKAGTIDLRQAEDWFRRAFESGCQQAQLRLGLLLEQRGDLAACESVYGVGVADGWAPAMYYLAQARLRLKAPRVDQQEARCFLGKAAAQGDLGAAMDLAYLSARGRFGLRQIPFGLRSLWSTCTKIVDLHSHGAFERHPGDGIGRDTCVTYD